MLFLDVCLWANEEAHSTMLHWPQSHFNINAQLSRSDSESTVCNTGLWDTCVSLYEMIFIYKHANSSKVQMIFAAMQKG